MTKYLIFLFFLIASSTNLLAQKDTVKTSTKNEVTLIVDEQPTPKNGMEGFYQWFSQKVKYPKEARKKGIEGRIFVQLLVGKDGTLSNFKILQGIGGGCDEEVIRVLNTAPRWLPGKFKGNPVEVRMSIPFFFKLN